jgi:hypothetical protein
MKTVAVISNVAFWLFFCLVIVTDGPPKGATAIVWSLVPFLIPVFNVAVIQILPSPNRVLKLAALLGNIVWLGLASWRIIQDLPSHPKEEGLLAFVVFFVLTPLLSAVAICVSLKAPQPLAAR